MNGQATEIKEEVRVPSNKFEWFDRSACLDTLVLLMDEGMKFDQAMRVIRLTDYAYNVSKMLVKQRTQLRRDAVNTLKDMQHQRGSAEIGDTVRIPRLIPGLLPGTTRRDGLRLVEGIIIDRVLISGSYRYTVKRLIDGGIQKGNGQMIKHIVCKDSSE